MQTKVYVVTELDGERTRVIAVKLTFRTAMELARQRGGRKVEKWIADK